MKLLATNEFIEIAFEAADCLDDAPVRDYVRAVIMGPGGPFSFGNSCSGSFMLPARTALYYKRPPASLYIAVVSI